ncbi:hypothetical protein E4656_12795 [Natronospirillum operosum]|uniref:Type II secretory pathway component n=1 Tax=Natronospirillum operosum TaxID=2759953 RepID=A0A4Z0W5I7_9GAMM|nr:hypothetical protein [Natronospirillum operosum]TGG92350.1 hypothetical protein E4656_12795 [Natronospirillum operosum]
MSEHRNHHWQAALLAASLASAFVTAEELSDPMRPTPSQQAIDALPTTPGAPAAEAEPAFDPAQYQVQQIYRMASIRRAQINGQWLTVGDPLGEAEVIAIEEAEVLLDVDGETHTLRLQRNRATFELRAPGRPQKDNPSEETR